MTHKERILHMVLFELIALCLFVPLAISATGGGAGHMTLLSIALSLIAMLWNYLYNVLFDKAFGENRLDRTFVVRVVHGLGFELGLVIFTIPVLMHTFKVGFWSALLMDIGVIIFFLVYAIVFNWCYDMLKKQLIANYRTTQAD